MGKNLAKILTKAKLSRWYEDLKLRQEQGLTVDEWCERQGVSRTTYYYRYGKVMQAMEEQLEEADNSSYEATQFAALPAPEETPPPACSSILIRLGALEVEIPSGADAASIAAVIESLKC